MMRRSVLPLALAAAMFSLSACSEETTAKIEPSGREAALDAKRGAERHEEKRFLVSWGDQDYRVNVRYVSMIGQTVVAVRRGEGDAEEGEWAALSMSADHPPLPDLPFEADEYGEIAVEIADLVSREGGVCPNGANLAIENGSDGDTKTMYRDDRQVWVVFARCPKAAEG